MTWQGQHYGGYGEQVPETCQENLRVQAALTKEASANRTKVFVYSARGGLFRLLPALHVPSKESLLGPGNMVKALPWYKSVREKLVDPAYSVRRTDLSALQHMRPRPQASQTAQRPHLPGAGLLPTLQVQCFRLRPKGAAGRGRLPRAKAGHGSVSRSGANDPRPQLPSERDG